jgi:biotin synthase-related radical SAM superfamily protein
MMMAMMMLMRRLWEKEVYHLEEVITMMTDMNVTVMMIITHGFLP